MEFHFHTVQYDYQSLARQAGNMAKSVGVDGLYLSLERPCEALRKSIGSDVRKPLLSDIPVEIGQQEMEYGNGVWVSANSNADWSFVATLQIVLDKPYWSISVEFDESNKNHETIKQLFVYLLEEIRPELAMGFNKVGMPFNNRYYSNSLGPWAGLRDVYWFNYWGKEYSELIGIDHLSGNNYFKSVEKSGPGIFFEIDKSYLENRAEIIQSIGEKYFIEEKILGGANQKGGLFGLMGTLYKLAKEDDAEGLVAKVHPVIKR